MFFFKCYGDTRELHLSIRRQRQRGIRDRPGHDDHKPAAPFQHLEKKYFQVGNEGFKVWDTMDTRMGMCICNDRRWPETFRVMGLQSAEVVVLGYNTPSHNIHWNEPPHLRMFHHLLLPQAHPHANALWVGSSAKSGAQHGFPSISGSAIVPPPWGQLPREHISCCCPLAERVLHLPNLRLVDIIHNALTGDLPEAVGS